MKKTSLLLVLFLAIGASAEPPTSPPEQSTPTPEGTVATNLNFPAERIISPTRSDLNCAGFVNPTPLPDATYVMGGLDTPNTTHYGDGEVIYLNGKGFELGKRYSIVRELRDPNRYEMFPGQFAMLRTMGEPYADLGIMRVLDTRGSHAIAQIEFSCSPIVPGDVVVPYIEKANFPAHTPILFDRFAPRNGKTSGRIVLAKDFDTELGTGMKVYLNLGANQGVKAGDYFRAVRSYETDLHDPVDSLSFKASVAEDTQAKPPVIERGMFASGKGPTISVADFPRRAVGEVLILSTTSTTSTGMIVFALEDVHVGDGVELDPQ
jgi:hypothetical protein